MSKNLSGVLLLVPQQEKIDKAITLLNDAEILHRTYGEEGKRSIGVAADDVYEAEEILQGIGVGVNIREQKGFAVFEIEGQFGVSDVAVRAAKWFTLADIPSWVVLVDGLASDLVCVQLKDMKVAMDVLTAHTWQFNVWENT